MSSQLIYLITFQSQPTIRYFVQPYLVTPLKSGGYGKPQTILSLEAVPDAYLNVQDKLLWPMLLKTLEAEPAKNDGPLCFPLQGHEGAVLFEWLVDTGRCYFASHRSEPLKLSVTRQGRLDWIKEVDGSQRLHCWISGGPSSILPFEPLWYVDHEKHECGILEVPLDAQIAAYLLFAPAMTSEQMQQLYALLKKAGSEKAAQKQLKRYLQKLQKPLTDEEVDYWYFDWQPNAAEKQWFDFEMGVSLEGKQINILPALAELVQSQLNIYGFAGLHQLPDDKIFYLKITGHKQFAVPMRRLRKILSMLTELYQEDGLHGNEKLRLSKVRALQLSTLAQAIETKQFRWHGDHTPQTLTEKFHQFKQSQRLILPKTFQGELRAYQEQGVRWLQFLRELGLGGVLADDMGLGKTVQMLLHLLIEKQKKQPHLPSLIIAPTSLVMNWLQEAKRFTPTLKILVLHGSDRKANYHKIEKFDVILSTYPLLIRDADVLLAQQYRIVVLDEAQYIKNFHSKAAKAVNDLQAEQRLCLTGTPMENHLGELWSLFHFLLPGLLGDRRQFQQLFRLPIEKNHDVERREYLRQRIAPFFLRRTKKEVLTELPEKIEMLRQVVLTDTQREIYENVRIALHEKVLLAVQARGLARSQIYILDALLKLRQVCCDPRLLKIDPNEYDDSVSAKFQLLMDLLPNLVAQGRRILLFSQFTEMLALIEKACINAKLDYVKLTGQTQHRHEVIQRFQNEPIPLFLISLKAGGVGLNLTQADTVIHYDPWWNPAAENQATDRAHRFGQDKTVFVYKLITSGTIEEKIMALQQEKQALLDAMMTGDGKTLDQFSLTDIEALFASLAELKSS